MRRIVSNSWWLVSLTLLGAVLAAGLVIRNSDRDHQRVQQRAVQHEVTQALSGSVQEVLSRERALSRVIGTSRSLSAVPWPVLANIVTGQSVAYGAGFVEPVSQQDRARWEQRIRVAGELSGAIGAAYEAGVVPALPRREPDLQGQKKTCTVTMNATEKVKAKFKPCS